MKNSIFTFALLAVLVSSCGPAAEDRDAMYARAKVFQDSIANVIKTSMDQAAAPVAGGQVAPVATPTSPATTTPGK